MEIFTLHKVFKMVSVEKNGSEVERQTLVKRLDLRRERKFYQAQAQLHRFLLRICKGRELCECMRVDFSHKKWQRMNIPPCMD